MKPPVIWTMTWLLFLDRFNAPQWLWGIILFINILFWLIYLYEHFTTDYDEVDLFENKQ